MPEFIDVCEQAARAAGKILVDMKADAQPREKSPRDLVTNADTTAQQAIRQILLSTYPEHLFAGEEDFPTIDSALHERSFAPSEGRYRWIVDPLDGTVNYVHGLPGFAVSIGLEYGGEPIVGVVFDPVANECYSAVRGEGAFLNGRKIHPSNCTRLEEALAAISFSANLPQDSPEIKRFLAVLHRSQSVRRLGSAALNLCYVASGRLDSYFATSVKAWDVAAGTLLVQEAGGALTGIDGALFRLADPQLLASSTQKLHAELIDVLAAVQ